MCTVRDVYWEVIPMVHHLGQFWYLLCSLILIFVDVKP
jgi:hypothetical protein